MTTVANAFKLCRAQFDSIIQSPRISDHASEVLIEQWKDELGRLLIWAGNIGAQQTRQASLDYRLRDASHIRDQVINLLHDILELLTDLSRLLEDEEDDSTDYYSLEDDMSDTCQMTEIQQVYHEIVETITQLYQMSMIIRAPAKHDRLVGIKKIDAEPFRHWALQHASQKFPHADKTTIERMGVAMTQQRAILKYRERHHAKLSQGLEHNDDNATILSDTIVSNAFIETQDWNDNASVGISETSYGATLLDGADGQASKIPLMPKAGANQSPFECPLCFYIITVRDKKSWARHVFRDLLPYVCTFQDCPTPNKLYETRKQWFYHIQHIHNFAIGPSDLHTCPICQEISIPGTRVQRHMGRHLEELSLFFVPKQEEEEQENDSDGDVPNSSVDSEGKVPKDAGSSTILETPPPDAKWTKIDRRLVNPEALTLGNEQFEESDDYVIVLRVLSREEDQAYAVRTQEIRELRYDESIAETSQEKVNDNNMGKSSKLPRRATVEDFDDLTEGENEG